MLNENVKKLLAESMWDLATCAGNEPNVVPVAFKDVTEDGKLVVGDVFLETTLNNLKADGGRIAISVYDAKSLEGYQIKGVAKYVTEGAVVDTFKAMVEKMFNGAATAKGALVILDKDIRCPLEYGLDVFGGKWNSRIICVLAAKGTLRYSGLRNELTNITDAVLGASLKILMKNGMINRQSYDEIPPRVEYSLTEKGMSVVPILQSICQWSGAYHKQDLGNVMQHCQKCDYNGSGEYGICGGKS